MDTEFPENRDENRVEKDRLEALLLARDRIDKNLPDHEVEKQVRQLTEKIFQEHRNKVEAHTIAAIHRKMKHSDDMMTIIDRIKNRLFAPEVIERCSDIDTLLSMFKETTNYALRLTDSLEKSRQALNDIENTPEEKPDVPDTSVESSGMSLKDRKKLQVAMGIITSLAQEKRKKELEKEAENQTKAIEAEVIGEFANSEEVDPETKESAKEFQKEILDSIDDTEEDEEDEY